MSIDVEFSLPTVIVLIPVLLQATSRYANQRRIDDVDEFVLFRGVLVEEQMELMEARGRDLPVVLVIQVAQRDGADQELVQVLDRFPAGDFQQCDGYMDKLSVRLNLGRMLMRQGRGARHDDICIEWLHAVPSLEPLSIPAPDVIVVANWAARVTSRHAQAALRWAQRLRSIRWIEITRVRGTKARIFRPRQGRR